MADAKDGKSTFAVVSAGGGGTTLTEDADAAFAEAKARRHLLFQCLLAEGIATMLLLYVGLGAIICSSVLNNETISVSRLLFISLCHGMAYAVLLYSLSFNSGHNDMSTRQMNPVLTLCLWVLRRMSATHMGMTIGVQVVGAVAGTGLLYISTPQRAFHYSTAEGVKPWQELIMSTIATFISVFVILITNFHHEDRREQLRIAKERRHKRLKHERERQKLGQYGDLHTRAHKQREHEQRARSNRRGTQINFTPRVVGDDAEPAPQQTAAQLRSYNLGRPMQPPIRVADYQLDGSVFARGGVFHGPISAVRPTTQSVDEYHCIVCGAAIFVCALVASAISGGFMNPLFVGGLDVLALRADVVPLVGPILGGGVAIGVAFAFGESTNLANSEYDESVQSARLAAAESALRLAASAQLRGAGVGAAAAGTPRSGVPAAAEAPPPTDRL